MLNFCSWVWNASPCYDAWLRDSKLRNANNIEYVFVQCSCSVHSTLIDQDSSHLIRHANTLEEWHARNSMLYVNDKRQLRQHAHWIKTSVIYHLNGSLCTLFSQFIWQFEILYSRASWFDLQTKHTEINRSLSYCLEIRFIGTFCRDKVTLPSHTRTL